MYGEHPNGGMTEIDSRNVDFLEDEFPTISEVKKDVELFELQQNIPPSFGEGEDLDSNQVTENGMSSPSKEMGETYLPRKMRIVLILLYMRKVTL